MAAVNEQGTLVAAQLRELLDKRELTDLVARASRAIDRCDEQLLLSCYHEDAVDDHGVYKGDPTGFVAYLRRRTMDPTAGSVQHAITTSLFDARATSPTGRRTARVAGC